MQESLLALFPLETVLLPEEPLPLHIFEDRYKLLIGECLEAKAAGKGQQEFGVVLAKGQALSAVGCTASILNVTRQYGDGRMDILTVGRRRFELLVTNEEAPYLRAAVDYFEDDGPNTPAEDRAAQAIERFREAMRLLRDTVDMPLLIPPRYNNLSYRIAASLPIDLEFKQHLLTHRNELERLSMIERAMEVLVLQLKRVHEVQKKAGGNGHAFRG